MNDKPSGRDRNDPGLLAYQKATMQKMVMLFSSPDDLRVKASLVYEWTNVDKKPYISDMRIPYDRLSKPDTRQYFLQTIRDLIDSGEHDKKFRLLLDDEKQCLIWHAPVSVLIKNGYLSDDDFANMEAISIHTEHRHSNDIEGLRLFFQSDDLPKGPFKAGYLTCNDVQKTAQSIFAVIDHYKTGFVTNSCIRNLTHLKTCIEKWKSN